MFFIILPCQMSSYNYNLICDFLCIRWLSKNLKQGRDIKFLPKFVNNMRFVVQASLVAKPQMHPSPPPLAPLLLPLYQLVRLCIHSSACLASFGCINVLLSTTWQVLALVFSYLTIKVQYFDSIARVSIVLIRATSHCHISSIWFSCSLHL